MRHNYSMRFSSLNQPRRHDKSTQALLAWLDPPRRPSSVDGVVQPICQTGRQVAANLALHPDVAHELACAVDDWLMAGRFGAPALPNAVPPAVLRVVAARLSGMALPNGARPLNKAISHREVHTGRTAKQRRNGRTPKWKKQGLVGPGGAWATAKRKAKEAGKPASYASAIYARMVGKSSGWDI